MALKDITRHVIEAAITEKRGEWSHGTCRVYLGSLSAILRRAANVWEWIDRAAATLCPRVDHLLRTGIHDMLSTTFWCSAPGKLHAKGSYKRSHAIRRTT